MLVSSKNEFTKFDMKKLFLLLICLVLVLIISFIPCNTISNKNNTTVTIKSNQKDILLQSANEKIEKEPLTIKEDIISIKQKLGEIENNLNQINPQIINKLNYELDKKLKTDKEILDISERNLTYPSMGINIIILFIGVFTICATMIGFYFVSKVKEFQSEIKESLAMARSMNAVDLYNKNKIESAIKEGSFALKCAIEAFGEHPSETNKKSFLSMLKSNLAYYWVAGEKIEDRETTLQYAQEGLKTGKIAFVDNFLYIFMKLARTEEEKMHWKEIYLAYKPDIETYYNPSSKKKQALDELKQYEEFYGKIA